jgi:hypothetical protein
LHFERSGDGTLKCWNAGRLGSETATDLSAN